MTILSVAVLIELSLAVSAFLAHDLKTVSARTPIFIRKWPCRLDASADTSPSEHQVDEKQLEQNAKYIAGLMNNLEKATDRYFLTGSEAVRERALNILRQIELESMDDAPIQQAYRLIKRSTMKFEPATELGKTDSDERKKEAEKRKQWEEFRAKEENVASRVGRSALSARSATNEKPDMFMPQIDPKLDDFAKDKKNLQSKMNGEESGSEKAAEVSPQDEETMMAAATKSAELVAAAGASGNFERSTEGIGGLDNVLAQVKRRIWVPLAAPPSLLNELGISPVRGLLLYGRPGCGKTLLARTIGRILSPSRPLTVVSGPEIMDKFVGSSEKNLREIFDNPPDIYDSFRIGEADGGDSMARSALHVIILDEFDAMARTRGGRGGTGDQGDAGVARDSVVNQMLAKMDGVDPLPVPTLVIGLTNKRSLIEPALLRPGRFEVQIEVPPPRTPEQRISILKVHTKNMFEAGRLLVRDGPDGSPAAQHVQSLGSEGVPTYEELLVLLAEECRDMMSGASIAGVARAAASHALERAVVDFSEQLAESFSRHPSLDCLVTLEDFRLAVEDVYASSGETDWEEDDSSQEESDTREVSDAELEREGPDML